MDSIRPPVLDTERLILRLARREDAGAVAAYFDREFAFLRPFIPAWPEAIRTERFWPTRLESNLCEYADGSAARFFAFLRSDPGRVVGTANLTAVVRGPFQAANLGYGLSAGLQGTGLMTEALRAVVHFAFHNWRLHRLQANYMPRNHASGAVLRKLGFTVEGYARNYLQIAGEWEDHVLTSLHNPRWPGRAKRTG